MGGSKSVEFRLSREFKTEFLEYARSRMAKSKQFGHVFPWLNEERLVLMFDEWVQNGLRVYDTGVMESNVLMCDDLQSNRPVLQKHNVDDMKDVLFYYVYCQAEWVGRRLYTYSVVDSVIQGYSKDFVRRLDSAMVPRAKGG